ncbi:MAG: flavodoxin [Muribaculaceae bacterium]|nr:flavodoxin [Muribaculaceae bacterium]
MKKLITIMAMAMAIFAVNAKTLVVYYSYTSNVNKIVTELTKQIDADAVRIEPAEKGLDYAANNYAIGSAQIASIRNNPNNASSYPAIDPVNVNFADYDCIIIGAPLWWSQMAAPLQTFLFHNGSAMAGKKIGLIVSSASSGISGVESDAKRLIPDGDFLSPSLWIKSAQTSNSATLIEQWLKDINYNAMAGVENIQLDQSSANYTVYSISGSLIGKNIKSIEGLDKGLYIINGKKICK